MLRQGSFSLIHSQFFKNYFTPNMKNKTLIFFIKNTLHPLVFSIFMFSSSAFALSIYDEDKFEYIDNSSSLTAFGSYVSFAKDIKKVEGVPSLPGQTNTSEKGIIPGLAFDIRSLFFTNLYTSFHLDIASGRLKYDGASVTTSTYEPYTYKSQNNIVNTDLKLGYIVLSDRSLEVIPYLSGGYRYWNRGHNNDIYRKEYTNYNANLGLWFNVLAGEDLILSPYGSIGKTFKPKVRNFYADQDFDLQGRLTYQLGLEFSYPITDDLYLTGFGNFTHIRFGRSAWIDGVIEPDTRTNEVKVGIGVRYSWIK